MSNELTEEWFFSVGFRYREDSQYYVLQHARMSMYVRLDGSFALSWSGTFGGTFYPYRNLANRAEVQALAEMCGFKSFGTPSGETPLTRAQKQKARELQCEIVESRGPKTVKKPRRESKSMFDEETP